MATRAREVPPSWSPRPRPFIVAGLRFTIFHSLIVRLPRAVHAARGGRGRGHGSARGREARTAGACAPICVLKQAAPPAHTQHAPHWSALAGARPRPRADGRARARAARQGSGGGRGGGAAACARRRGILAAQRHVHSAAAARGGWWTGQSSRPDASKDMRRVRTAQRWTWRRCMRWRCATACAQQQQRQQQRPALRTD